MKIPVVKLDPDLPTPQRAHPGDAGVDLYAGGKLTAEHMIKVGGLKAGDEAMVYGVFSQAERGLPIILPEDFSYYDLVREKLGWGSVAHGA